MSSTPVVTSDNHTFDVILSSSASNFYGSSSSKQIHIQRRMNELVLVKRLTQLTNENEILRAKIDMLFRKFLKPNPTLSNIDDSSVSSTTEQISSLPLNF